MRWILKRYVSVETQWEPVFVLERITDRTLGGREDGSPTIFPTIRDAIRWVVVNDAQGSIEWEGTTF